MVPDLVPGVGQQAADRLVIRLAGDHLSIRFDAHIVERGRAAFDAQFEQNRVEMAVFGGGVPDQALAGAVRMGAGQFEQGRQFFLAQPGAHRFAAAGIDQGVQAKGGHAQLAQEIERGRQIGMVVLQQGGVGHHKQAGRQDIAQPGDGILPGALGMHHAVVDFRQVRFQGDLNVIQTGIHQGLHEGRIFQAPAVGVDPGDLAVMFGMSDQFGQVGAQGGLAAGEDDVRNADFPQAGRGWFSIRRWSVRGSGASGRYSSARSRCCSGRSAPDPCGRARKAGWKKAPAYPTAGRGSGRDHLGEINSFNCRSNA